MRRRFSYFYFTTPIEKWLLYILVVLRPSARAPGGFPRTSRGPSRPVAGCLASPPSTSGPHVASLGTDGEPQLATQAYWGDSTLLGRLETLLGQLDVTGATRDFTGATRDFTGATQDFTGATQDFTGATQDFTGATQDFTGVTQLSWGDSTFLG